MKSLNLCLHTGATLIPDRDALSAVGTPEATPSWYPVPHRALLDRVATTLEATGLKIVNESHAIARGGLRYFGLLQVANGENSADFSLVVGLRNSHDKCFPAGLVVGSGVFVCDNLAFSGEIRIARRHTRYINRDLPQLVNVAVGRLGEARHLQDRRIECYRNTTLEDQQVHDLLIRSVDARVISNARVPDVLNEWRTPRHPEFASARTGWRLMNAFTQTMTDSLIFNRPRQTQALHGLLDVACKVIA